MTRIIGHMVTRNELGRYLKQTLSWLCDLTDEVVVYDDQSDDGTFEYVRSQPNIALARRPDTVASFAEDESRFRQAAWAFMEATVWPGGRDWILCVDADEFLVTDHPDGHIGDTLRAAIARCRAEDRRAANINVREVFGFERALPLIRTDAYWGGITACRLVRWRQGAHFIPCPEGGGSVPTTWLDRHHLVADLSLLHLGYARTEDRHTKHHRYVGGHHNPTHIASILSPPRLKPWTGLQPPLVAGLP